MMCNVNSQIFACNYHQLVVEMRFSAKNIFLNTENHLVYISWLCYFTKCYDFVEE